jgi:hypothetical protein
MSEYVSKKAVLEWFGLMHLEYSHNAAVSEFIESGIEIFESGAFDADNTEIQRLRAALVKARAVMEDALSVGEATYEDFDIKLNPWADLSMGVEEINKTLYQTPTEPRVEEREGDLIGYWINEKCPKCGADMLGNKVGDKWCSLVGCDYSINAPEGDGNDA